jgi:hypothetical protein
VVTTHEFVVQKVLTQLSPVECDLPCLGVDHQGVDVEAPELILEQNKNCFLCQAVPDGSCVKTWPEEDGGAMRA